METTTTEKKTAKKSIKKPKYDNLLNAIGIYKNDKISLSEIRKQVWK